MTLDPRAQKHEVAAAARHYTGSVRAFLHGAGKCMPAGMTAHHLDQFALARQAPAVAPGVELSGRVARMLDVPWWVRGMRRTLLRENEAIEFSAGRIRRRAQCYVSDHAIHAKAKRAKANAAILAALEVVNEDGHVANLGEVAAGSVSNPKLRRGELMVRCRGFEEVAAMMGHEAVFLTITCPSRFHRFDGQGKPNPKWDGATPRDAQAYLREVWARIRAGWKRAGIAPYGFRVAEPHHDGCPHWHVLLFAPAHHVGWFVSRRFVADRNDHGAGLVGIAGRHALADSAGESGAVKHRFTCEKIDAARGSATAYIAKYIAKNIDGEKEDGDGVGLDFASGTRASDAAQRVRVWASTWGIRQFQQIGGPSVTVWRELRRLAKDAVNPVCQLEIFEGPRSAADRAMWGMFWFLQGGPDVSRRELTLRPGYVPVQGGRYGDTAPRVQGVVGFNVDTLREHFERTRLHTWTVQVAGLAAADDVQAAWTFTLHNRQRNADFFAAMNRAEVKRSGEAASTWTGVNNCTVDDEAAALQADFLRGAGGQMTGVDPPCNRHSGAEWRESQPKGSNPGP